MEHYHQLQKNKEQDDISETSTNCSSEEEDESQALQPLLWVSELSFSGTYADEFALTIGRSSYKQRFGITFHVHSNGDLVIAEDAMQFGILKGDIVLGINGTRDSNSIGILQNKKQNGAQAPTVENCQRILHSSLQVELNLCRTNFDAKTYQGEALAGLIDWKTLSTSRHGFRCVDLLSVGPQQPVSGGPGNQFTVRISRVTRNQKFGLQFRSIKCRSGKTEIYCVEDQKHLGLRDGDQILSLNGCTVRSVNQCSEILDECMSVELHIERQSKILDKLHQSNAHGK